MVSAVDRDPKDNRPLTSHVGKHCEYRSKEWTNGECAMREVPVKQSFSEHTANEHRRSEQNDLEASRMVPKQSQSQNCDHALEQRRSPAQDLARDRLASL